ncbi:CBS domain-containing protein [Kibdelosporangium philippinense]|uniref:CBS domain-containing protein n=1 Tax=Kibdelosporangium philippinense TaxID=211113 RepID=A0ABS8Z283_9PSEU|nr:CBS domain-containing protein [Kibdelosporangium philippinense]MCE7002046.1 CBS domain-containing protein [Kibdelosporangium philippinense]
MGEPAVAEVMTRQVITAVPDTPFKELAGAMLAHGIDVLPVIDIDGRPLGVVSEADVLTKLEFHGGADPTPMFAGPRCRSRWYKSLALHAADLMTTPPITTTPGTPVSTAIHLMARMRIRQICVVACSGHLIGMLARRDALHLFVRGDSAIEADIERVITTKTRRPNQVTVHVTDGVVTLDGTLTLHSAVQRAGVAAHHIPGVVAVRNNLRYDIDDLMITGL